MATQSRHAGQCAEVGRRVKIFDTDVERVTTRYGRLFVASKDSVIGRSLKVYGEWAEPEIDAYSALLSDGETIIDVGANIGTHSVALASRFPHSEIVAFEPQPFAYSLLVANALAARAGNIYPRNCGCAESRRIVEVSVDYEAVDWNIGGFRLNETEQRDATPVLLLDLDSQPFNRRVQFIKIDVEGMEEAVLSGARGLLARDRPLIYFEVLEIDRLAPIRELLSSLGYKLRWLASDAYNSLNFRCNPENIWRKGETGILALPADDSRVARLPLVTGKEQVVPTIEYAAG